MIARQMIFGHGGWASGWFAEDQDYAYDAWERMTYGGITLTYFGLNGSVWPPVQYRWEHDRLRGANRYAVQRQK